MQLHFGCLAPRSTPNEHHNASNQKRTLYYEWKYYERLNERQGWMAVGV